MRRVLGGFEAEQRDRIGWIEWFILFRLRRNILILGT